MGDWPVKLNEKKSDRELERKIRSYLLEEQHEIFFSGGEKMRNPSGHQVENERVKKCEQHRVRHFLHRTCNYRKFLEVSRCGRAKQRQRNVQEKCAARAKFFCLFVCLFRPIVVFSPFSLPSPLSITRFYILFEQTINIIESFAFSPG